MKTLSRKYINTKIGNLPISRELNRVDKSDDYKRLQPRAKARKDSKWRKKKKQL